MFVLHIASRSGSPDWPAWVQAIGSILAILAAWIIPDRQRKRALADAHLSDIQREKDHVRRITSALNVEISEALAASVRQERTMRTVLKTIESARAQGRSIKSGPLNPKAAVVTDGVIYAQAASDIGRLPEVLIQRVILFYSAAREISRIAEVGGEFETTLSNITAQGPGFRMYGELALCAIRKLREANYEPSAQLEPTIDESKEMAERAGYPLEQVLKEHVIRTQQPTDASKH